MAQNPDVPESASPIGADKKKGSFPGWLSILSFTFWFRLVRISDAQNRLVNYDSGDD